MTVTMQVQNTNDEFISLMSIMVRMVLSVLAVNTVVALVTPMGFIGSLFAILAVFGTLMIHDEVSKPADPNPLYVTIIAFFSYKIIEARSLGYFDMVNEMRHTMMVERGSRVIVYNKRDGTTVRRSVKTDNRSAEEMRKNSLGGFGLGMVPA